MQSTPASASAPAQGLIGSATPSPKDRTQIKQAPARVGGDSAGGTGAKRAGLQRLRTRPRAKVSSASAGRSFFGERSDDEMAAGANTGQGDERAEDAEALTWTRPLSSRTLMPLSTTGVALLGYISAVVDDPEQSLKDVGRFYDKISELICQKNLTTEHASALALMGPGPKRRLRIRDVNRALSTQMGRKAQPPKGDTRADLGLGAKPNGKQKSVLGALGALQQPKGKQEPHQRSQQLSEERSHPRGADAKEAPTRPRRGKAGGLGLDADESGAVGRERGWEEHEHEMEMDDECGGGGDEDEVEVETDERYGATGLPDGAWGVGAKDVLTAQQTADASARAQEVDAQALVLGDAIRSGIAHPNVQQIASVADAVFRAVCGQLQQHMAPDRVMRVHNSILALLKTVHDPVPGVMNVAQPRQTDPLFRRVMEQYGRIDPTTAVTFDAIMIGGGEMSMRCDFEMIDLCLYIEAVRRLIAAVPPQTAVENVSRTAACVAIILTIAARIDMAQCAGHQRPDAASGADAKPRPGPQLSCAPMARHADDPTLESELELEPEPEPDPQGSSGRPRWVSWSGGSKKSNQMIRDVMAGGPDTGCRHIKLFITVESKICSTSYGMRGQGKLECTLEGWTRDNNRFVKLTHNTDCILRTDRHYLAELMAFLDVKDLGIREEIVSTVLATPYPL